VLEAVEGWPAADKVRGHARFVAPGVVQVDDHTRIAARTVVIATGSAPHVPDGWREALGDRLLTSEDVFDWHTLPESVAVTGGGVIG
jgi:dihydrolipoamide dehydrogenase